MKYSILWDHSTAPLRGNFSLSGLYHEIETYFRPGVMMQRKDAMLYADDPHDLDDHVQSMLSQAHFNIHLSRLPKGSSEADEKLFDFILQYLKEYEDLHFFMICGQRNFGPRFLHFLNYYSSRLTLVYVEGTCQEIRNWSSCSSIPLQEIIKVIGSNEKVSSQQRTDGSSGHPPEVMVPPDDVVPNFGYQSGDQEMRNTVNVVQSESVKAHRYLCMFIHDSEQVSDLQEQLEKASKHLNGSVIVCSSVVGILELSSRDDIDRARVVLNSLDLKFGIEKISIGMIEEPTLMNQSPLVALAPVARNNMFSEKFKRDYICMIDYDMRKEKEVLSTLEGVSDLFGGELLFGIQSVATMKFNSTEHREKAKYLLNSFPYATFTTLLTIDWAQGVTDRHQKKILFCLAFHPKVNYSKQRGELPRHIERVISSGHPQPTAHVHRQAMRVSDSDDLKHGYFLLFHGLQERNTIRWYHAQIQKIMGNIFPKFFFLDPESDWAMIQFYTEFERNSAHELLTGKTLDGQTMILYPEATDTLPDSYIERVKARHTYLYEESFQENYRINRDFQEKLGYSGPVYLKL